MFELVLTANIGLKYPLLVEPDEPKMTQIYKTFNQSRNFFADTSTSEK
jgi:hypothetical protein